MVKNGPTIDDAKTFPPEFPPESHVCSLLATCTFGIFPVCPRFVSIQFVITSTNEMIFAGGCEDLQGNGEELK